MRLVLPTPLYRLLTRHPPRRRRKGQGARTRPVTLARPRIFILPTRLGLLFALILFTILLGAVNYGNSLGLALSFLLAGMGFIAILHTYRNLARLEFSIGRVEPVFAGQTAHFSVLIKNAGAARHALVMHTERAPPVGVSHIAAHSVACAPLALPALRRGELPLGRLTVSTRFPLGLFCAWSYLQLDARCLVYPAPRTAPEPARGTEIEQGVRAQRQGDDDFSGQRAYRAGDTLARINWKAVARGMGWMTKEFADTQGGAPWADWNALHAPDTELRLSQLCQIVLDLDRSGQPFGLRLPGRQIEPARGDTHRHACLAALALFSGA